VRTYNLLGCRDDFARMNAYLTLTRAQMGDKDRDGDNYIVLSIVDDSGVEVEGGRIRINTHKTGEVQAVRKQYDGAYDALVPEYEVAMIRRYMVERGILEGECLFGAQVAKGRLGSFIIAMMIDSGIPHYGGLTMKRANYLRHMYYTAQDRSTEGARVKLAQRMKHSLAESFEYFRISVRTVAELLRTISACAYFFITIK
jgi:hypothetical protein